MITDEGDNNKDFLLRRVLLNLEADRIGAALALATAYASQEGDAEAEEFRDILYDLPLMRKLHALDAIKANPETCFEYYDKDMDNDPYVYDEAVEKRLTDIKVRIASYIGRKLETENKLSALLDSL